MVKHIHVPIPNQRSESATSHVIKEGAVRTALTVDLAFEVKKLAGQRAASPDASGAQFRERAFGDALANGKGLETSACRLRQNWRIGLSGPKGS